MKNSQIELDSQFWRVLAPQIVQHFYKLIGMEAVAISILKEKKLRITPTRVELLALFLQSSKAFSLSDIETLFGSKYDRSTLFRSLHFFHTEHILEKFIDARGVSIYTLNTPTTNKGDLHCHFKCNDCETVLQLPELPQYYLSFLGSNTVKTLNLFIEGTCENCQLIDKQR